MDERREAIAWFNAKDDLDKSELCFIYYGTINYNNFKSLTGRQIENIWKGETEKRVTANKDWVVLSTHKYIGECKGNDGNGCFLDACGHDCGCFTLVNTTDSPTLKEIDGQVSVTQKRGEKIVQYLKKYEGQSIYNEIALAIEFGYQIKQEEEDEEQKIY